MVSSALEAGHETGEVTRVIDQAQFLHRALSFGVPIEASQNYRLSTEREWSESHESVLPTSSSLLLTPRESFRRKSVVSSGAIIAIAR